MTRKEKLLYQIGCIVGYYDADKKKVSYEKYTSMLFIRIGDVIDYLRGGNKSKHTREECVEISNKELALGIHRKYKRRQLIMQPVKSLQEIIKIIK